jgi:Ca2+-transporting ATPase
MWKMIIGQVVFQLAVTVTLHFAGAKILGYDETDEHQALQLDSMVFNTFVWLQIFNELNSRRLDNGFNCFAGLHRNPYFIGINLLMVGCQVTIMFVGGVIFSVTTMTGPQWAISVLIPALSLPWAILVRLFPDETFGRIVGIVTWPAVKAYSVLQRIFAPLGRLISRKKKDGATENDKEKARS